MAEESVQEKANKNGDVRERVWQQRWVPAATIEEARNALNPSAQEALT